MPTPKNNYEAILLKKPFVFVYFILLILANYLAPVYISDYNTVIASNIATTRLVELANLDRQNVGLGQLAKNSMLDKAAHAKALDMLEKDYWNHFGPSGETPWQFIKGAGYEPYSYAGENLAKGFATSEGVHQAWMASPTHKANIMDADYRDIGIAVVDGYLEGKKVTLVVQMFGRLKTDNSYNLAVDQRQIDEYETGIKPDTPEAGDTTSIKIKYPEEGAILNSAKVPISGTTEGSPESARIIISNGNTLVGESALGAPISGETTKWEYNTGIDWNQGDYEIKTVLRADGEDLADDSVRFKVDSVGPNLTLSMLNQSYGDNMLEILFVPDEPVESYLTVDNSIYPVLSNDGIYTVSVPVKIYDNAKNVILAASDEYGNRTEVVLKNDDSTDFSVASILGLTSTGGVVNFSFLTVLLGFIILQISQYTRLGMLQHKAHYLFAGIMFASVLLIGLITKSTGLIG